MYRRRLSEGHESEYGGKKYRVWMCRKPQASIMWYYTVVHSPLQIFRRECNGHHVIICQTYFSNNSMCCFVLINIIIINIFVTKTKVCPLVNGIYSILLLLLTKLVDILIIKQNDFVCLQRCRVSTLCRQSRRWSMQGS